VNRWVRVWTLSFGIVVLLATIFVLASSQVAEAVGLPANTPLSAPSNKFPQTSPGGTDSTYMITELCPNRANCMPGKITPASIYVPEDISTDIVLTIIDGCHTGIDNPNGTSSTTFSVWYGTEWKEINTSNSSCNSSKDLTLNFPPVGRIKVVGGSPDKWGTYNRILFTANAIPTNGVDNVYYFNHFRLSADNARVRIGISDFGILCNINVYPNSCPARSPDSTMPEPSRESFTSFAQPPSGTWEQEISVRCEVDSYLKLNIYDLDAGVYGQTNIRGKVEVYDRNGAYTGTIPNPIPDELFGIRAVDDDGFFLNAQAGSGNDQIATIPGTTGNSVLDEIVFKTNVDENSTKKSDGTLDRLILKGGNTYVFKIKNLNKVNTLTVLPRLSLNADGTGGNNCATPPPPRMTCNAIANTSSAVGGFVQVSFRINNNSTFDWVPDTSTHRYDMGVVDMSFAGARLDGNGTTAPRNGTGGNGPPDHLSAGYIRDGVSGTNNIWHSVPYNRDVATGPFNQFVERYGTTVTIPAKGSAEFSVWVQVPSSGTKDYGIRMLGRDTRFAPYSWMDWSDSCAFSVDVPGVIDFGPMSCSALTSTTGAPGSYIEISFNIRNKTNFDWVPSGNTYDIGVVDTSFSGAKLNGAASSAPRRGLGGDGPPDHQSASYVRDNTNGLNAIWHRDNYNRDNAAGPLDQAVERYGTAVNIPVGWSVSFSVWVQVPSSGIKNYGIRMLSQDSRFAPYYWMDWSESCAFSVSATAENPKILSCKVSSIPVTVGETFYLKVTLDNANTSSVDISGGAKYTLSRGGVSTTTGNGKPYDTSTDEFLDFPRTVPNGGSIAIWSETTLSVASAGVYDVLWEITTATGVNADEDCGKIIYGAVNANNNPYVHFYGNDVIAGGGYGDCTVTGSGNARGYGLFGSPRNHASYKGTASELAVFATGQIDGVLPGFQDITRNSLTALSFSNSNSSVGSGSLPFGGGFSDIFCADNLWAKKPSNSELMTFTPVADGTVTNPNAVKVNLNNLGNGSYYYRHSEIHIFSNTKIPAGKRITIYVEGNAVIGRSNPSAVTELAYDTAVPWTDTSQIPLIKIITLGNIYVDNDITQMDGMYVAVPDPNRPSGTDPTGEIHTCALFSSGLNLLKESTDERIATQCRTKLTVNGAFIAKKVQLLRSIGNVPNAGIAPEPYTSANIAEVFRFSPELYLALLSEGQPDGTFDAILSLPPAL